MIQLDKLTAALDALKTLCAEQKRYEAIRNKTGSMNRTEQTPKRINKAHADMHFQAAHVRRCHKAAWAAIVAADLETTLSIEEVSPTGWQRYEI